MADYNVQMKQYNGTSFDNILPYASQALTLAGGGSATEIIAQARAGLSQIATGSYVGTGVQTENFTMTIQLPFRPKIVFVFYTGVEFLAPDSSYARTSAAFYPTYAEDKNTFYDNAYYGVWFEGLEETPVWSYQARKGGEAASKVVYSATEDSFSWTTKQVSGYKYDYSGEPGQNIFNLSSKTYRYVAFGGFGM